MMDRLNDKNLFISKGIFWFKFTNTKNIKGFKKIFHGLFSEFYIQFRQIRQLFVNYKYL